jgi:3-phenylpropionate/trans-cinnamate dioxygenase ferredoxin reductase subunit
MALRTIVIVGASMAGGRAAETLRAEGFDGRIVLVGAEPDRPYERPPLSKELLRGELPSERVFLRPAEFYAEQQIETRYGIRAIGLDPDARVVELESGERIGYDALLIATGASPRRLQVPGAELEGIYYLRTLRDAERLRAALQAASRVVVVGAGFIGAEVAASSRQMGLEVVLLEALAAPLLRVLGADVGHYYAQFHREQGVDVRLNAPVAGFRGQGQVEAVVLGDDQEVPCDLAVVGVGVVPEVAWLAGSGVALDNGVLADEWCRTNRPGVYAAGDVANWWHPRLGERLRVEHYDNAQNQGVAAARSILSRGAPYAPVPFFWSDQYDLTLQYVGHASRWDATCRRGRPEDRSFITFYLHQGRIRAALGVNRFKDVSAARRLIEAGVVVEPERLADESVELRRLLPR